jgi:hypothetical protein
LRIEFEGLAICGQRLIVVPGLEIGEAKSCIKTSGVRI